MNLELKLIKGKVAQRIFFRFVLCALLPIITLSLISYTQVKGELKSQEQKRLHEDAIHLGEAISERLTNIENDLFTISQTRDFALGLSNQKPDETLLQHLKKQMNSLCFINAFGEPFPIFGELPHSFEISSDEQAHLDSGRALVQVKSIDNHSGGIYMLKRMDPKKPESGMIYAEINGMYLWGLDAYNTLPAFTEMAVLDTTNNVIFSTHPSVPDFNRYGEFHKPRSSISMIEWEHQGQQYQADFRSLFLKYNWFYPRLIIVISSPKDYIFAPIEYFKIVFPLVVILAILVVLFLSAIQIRRVTQPIEELKMGSKRIARQQFGAGVNIKSGDEFEELGEAFNEMAKRLENQFQALGKISEISRAILSSLNTKEIIDFLIYGIKDYFEYDLVKVSLFDPDEPAQAWIYSDNQNIGDGTIRKIIRLPLDKLIKDIGNKHIVSFQVHDDLPKYLTPILVKGIEALTLLPLFTKQKLSGIIILGTNNPASFNQERLVQARQLADQVAVALANARLLEELDKLNWGTLYALARTVDAKSRWTGNHSERVADIAFKLGKVMGLSKENLDNLRRAALLHDIGKIAVPLHILDKESELSEKEFKTIQEHPEIGARILEPISAYAPIIAMIHQHHERFDGTGYPEGLSGKNISLGARILAVADVYDALASDRPYRSAIAPKEIIDSLLKESGEKFDPKVIDALKMVIRSRKYVG